MLATAPLGPGSAAAFVRVSQTGMYRIRTKRSDGHGKRRRTTEG